MHRKISNNTYTIGRQRKQRVPVHMSTYTWTRWRNKICTKNVHGTWSPNNTKSMETSKMICFYAFYSFI